MAVLIPYFQSNFWNYVLFDGVMTYDVTEKLSEVSDYAMYREGHGKDTAMVNLKVLCLTLPRGTE
jgi:hypothetical protein